MVADCMAVLKAEPHFQIPGLALSQAAKAVCKAVEYAGQKGEPLETAVQKARTSRWPSIAKAVSGGLDHVVSVDNGANYAELWFKEGNWYAVTGASLDKSKMNKSEPKWSIYAIPRVYKGMPADEATTRFLGATFGPDAIAKSGGCGCGGKK